MSTRGAYGFRLNGKDYISYNHSDSYPSGLGADILKQAKHLATLSPAYVKGRVLRLKLIKRGYVPTAEDIKRLVPYTNLGVSDQSNLDVYCLTRNLQGELLTNLKVGYMADNVLFLADSLFCEYAYIVNLDTRQLECYIGFNKNPNAAGRYANMYDPPAGGGPPEYYGVRLVLSYPLGRLPSESRFLTEMKKKDRH